MNQKLQFHIVAAGVMAICLVAATAAADTYTLGPTEDVCVRDDYPNTAGNPTGSLLYVGGPIVSTNDYWTTFIKFDLSSYGAGTINSATLKLTCQSHSGSSVSVSTYEVTADPYDWDEDYMSQQTAEANLTVSTSPTANVTVNAANTAFSFDVTGAARNHKGGDFTICVKQSNQPSSGNWAMFYSKDYSTTPSYQPDLVLNYTPPSQDNGRIYIDFDPSFSIENIAYPDIYTGFDAYVVLDQMSQGFAGICFALSVTPGTSSPPAFENLLPGDLAIGDWETGITMASTDCVGMGGEPVNMAVLHLYYLGEPGDILILDHPEWPRWIVDCTQPYGLVTYYCVLSHGGVGKDAPPGDCGATPVQARSWTGIKSLYR
ncbi:MAG: DNRLRE domain-containing protein [Candidatus Eisenbacteria bacterium]|nr:DNRLRE domain-containing protein [Candidatus Eisenbacteria bacterium]